MPMSVVISFWTRRTARLSALVAVLAIATWSAAPAAARQQATVPPPGVPGARTGAPPAGTPTGRGQGRGPDFAGDQERQTVTDATWRAGSQDVMSMQKTTYKSQADGLEIPVFIFKPLKIRGPKQHAALVWVHPDIRGHVYEYYIPYVREAVARGYVVIAPEYRGSVGYGQAFYDAIDYGGLEVDDVVTAVSVLKTMPEVDPARIGIIGWSHGGMITMLSIERNPTFFKAAAAMVPVTNLFQRLAWKKVDRQHQAIDPQNRYGGLPGDSAAINQVYKDRSPLYGVDKIQTPVIVHVTKNDQDVNIEEDMQLVDALRSRKADLAETKVYEDPLGGHLFDRMCPATLPNAGRVDMTKLENFTPTDTREQRDSWARVWAFLDWHLDPYHGSDGK
jgi:dipeptidyl aminopeptidase/acylaminoacyl peptidase